MCKRDSGEVFVLKSFEKQHTALKNQVGHVKAERDVLAMADNHHSFQDVHRLYEAGGQGRYPRRSRGALLRGRELQEASN